MAQCYIDSAKRTFAIDLNKEMLKLSKSECMIRDKKYPKFFAKIKESKISFNVKDSDNKKLKNKEDLAKINDNIIEDCKCPMDMIAKIISDNILPMTGTNKNGLLNIKNFIVKKDEIEKNKNRDGHKQLVKLEKIITEYDNKMCNLNSKDNDYKDKAMLITDDVIERLSKLSISKENMHKLIRVAFGLEKGKFNKNMCNRILVLLYNYDVKNSADHKPKKFLSLFIKSPQKTL
jgi:hypothetical protein